MSKKYKKMGSNQKPMPMPIANPDGIETFLRESKIGQGAVVRISMKSFKKHLQGAVSSWPSAFVEANYKPNQTVLSGEAFASVSRYPGEPYSTLKIYTGRPDGRAELAPNLSAYTVMDFNVVAFKFDENLKVQGNAVALEHQKPQAPYDPDCRSPAISSNTILSGLAFDTPEPMSSLTSLSALPELDKYIDSRLGTISNVFNAVPNANGTVYRRYKSPL